MVLLKILLTFLNISLTLIFIVPILFSLVVVPFGLYRLLIRALACIFRRHFVSMVQCRDAIFANDKFSSRPNSTIVVMLWLEGDVDLEVIRKTAVQQMFGGNCSPSPKQKYAVLMQYFENWGGFVFRKWEKNFDVKNHSREWRKSGEVSTVTPDDVYELRRKLLVEPFKPGMSAWESVLVRNYQESEFKPKGTILLTKFHHGLVDGYSIIKLFVTTIANITDVDVRSVLPVPNAISAPLSPLQNVAIFSKLFAEFVSTAQNQNPGMDPANIFHPNHAQTKSRLTGARHPVSTTIPLKTVKNAAKQSGTSYTAVIMAGLTGGVRNYLTFKNKDVPKTIDVTIPVPWPGHDDNKVQNHFTYVVIEIPTGLPDELQRLQNLHDQFLRLKRSSAPAFNYVIAALVGMLPNPVMTRVLKGNSTSILLSSIPGPNRPIQIFDRSLVTPPSFEGGYGQGPVGMGVAMLSCNEEVSITINPEVGAVPTKFDAEKLLGCIVNEIQLIHDSTFV